MYKFFAGIFHNIIYALKFVQILGLFYLLLFVIYWFLEIIMSSYAGMLDFIYTIPIELTEKLFDSFGIQLSSEYTVLKPMIFFSIVLTFVALLIYNFIFIPLDNILEYFIDKSYSKGERGI